MKFFGLVLSGIILLAACKQDTVETPRSVVLNTDLSVNHGRHISSTGGTTTTTGGTTTTAAGTTTATSGTTTTTSGTTTGGTTTTTSGTTTTTTGGTATSSGSTVTSGTTSSTAGINSLAQIEQDMDLNGEALPYGMPSNFNWYSHPRINAGSPGGNNPGGSPAIFPWFCIFPTGGVSPATNTRVQLRNIYIYYLSKSTNKWILATGSNGVNGYYDDYTTNTNMYNITVDKRTESLANGGGTSIKLLSGYCVQGWTSSAVGAIDPNDIAGIWAYCEARLIVDNTSLPDDRSIANLIVCQGGDYKTLTATTTGDIAIGRFKKVTNSWRAFNMSTLTDAQWAAAPAPPINSFD